MHAIVFSPDAEKVRAFVGDVLGLSSVDAGRAGSFSLCRLPDGGEFPIYEPRHPSPLDPDRVHSSAAYRTALARQTRTSVAIFKTAAMSSTVSS